MTIITKTSAGDKKPLDEEMLVQSESLPVMDDEKYDEDHSAATVVHTSKAKRMKNSAALFVLFIALMVVIICTLAGIHFYQKIAREKIYHSSISLPIDHPVHEGNTWNLPNSELQKSHQATQNFDSYRKPDYIHEEFHIDLEKKEYERITVTHIPRSLNGRRATFIHVFSTNKTGIVDVERKRCYIMSLDRTRILAPQILFEVMVKTKAKFFKMNTAIIRQALRLVGPQIRNYQPLGYNIAQECVGFKTFRLERMTRPVFKRSAESEGIKFYEFAGNMMEYHIVNADEE